MALLEFLKLALFAITRNKMRAFLTMLGIIVGVGAVIAMFAPIVFVHPMRVMRLRTVTMAVLALWSACAAWALASGMTGSWLARAGLLACAIYCLVLPLLVGRSLKPEA